jgi:hypothetical protein
MKSNHRVVIKNKVDDGNGLPVFATNGRESAINRVLDGSTYPGKKHVPPSLGKNFSC